MVQSENQKKDPKTPLTFSRVVNVRPSPSKRSQDKPFIVLWTPQGKTKMRIDPRVDRRRESIPEDYGVIQCCDIAHKNCYRKLDG